VIGAEDARERDRSGAAPPHPGAVLYVLTYLPTYIQAEVSELQRRGVQVSIVLPATWPRAAMWDHITGRDRNGADGPHLRTSDFRYWLTEPPQVLRRPAARLLARVWVHRGVRALRLAARCWRAGIFRHYLAAAWLSEVLADRSTEAIGGAREAPPRRAAGAHAIDRVHAHFAADAAHVGAALAELLGVPFSLTTHANDIFVPQDPQHVARLLASAAPALTISHFNRDYLARVFGPAVARPVRVVHLGVDVDTLPRWSPAAEVFTIVCTASGLVEKKGLGVLFDACAVLRARGVRLRCQVCGADPGEKRLAELRREVQARGLANEVSLLGAVPWTETLQLMARAHVFVLAAIRTARGEMDGIPVSLIEAMGIGVPVVSTHVSGIPELIEDGRSGLLVAAGDASALADAIERLQREPALAQAIGAQARRRVDNAFSVKRSVDALLAAWDETAAASAAPRTP
jgi:glycosyltransferase involved in cell wall biosynthesis